MVFSCDYVIGVANLLSIGRSEGVVKRCAICDAVVTRHEIGRVGAGRGGGGESGVMASRGSMAIVHVSSSCFANDVVLQDSGRGSEEGRLSSCLLLMDGSMAMLVVWLEKDGGSRNSAGLVRLAAVRDAGRGPRVDEGSSVRERQAIAKEGTMQREETRAQVSSRRRLAGGDRDYRVPVVRGGTQSLFWKCRSDALHSLPS
jgi:hypothetical protein